MTPTRVPPASAQGKLPARVTVIPAVVGVDASRIKVAPDVVIGVLEIQALTSQETSAAKVFA